jgi:hypothetical protein
MTPEEKTHLLEIVSRMPKEYTSPALDIPPRTREQAAFDLAYEALEAVVALSHEKTVVQYARRQLERIDELRR